MTVVDVLRKYQGGMTQTEYADLLGITQGYLSLIYSGARKPGGEVIRGLLRAFPKAAKDITRAIQDQPETISAAD